MLWYKGWLETRFRLLMSLAVAIFFLVSAQSDTVRAHPPAQPFAGLVTMVAGLAVVCYSWLAGAGITTQPPFQAAKGLHGSTTFTLSLPVSRLRLLAVRASLGWVEMAGVLGAVCSGLWFATTVFRETVTVVAMVEYAVTLVACASAPYFLSVLLATFLDELWRIYAGMIAFGILWALSVFNRLPAGMDIVRAMLGNRSPLVAQTIPWSTVVFSLGLSAMLFLVAVKIAQAREYNE